MKWLISLIWLIRYWWLILILGLIAAFRCYQNDYMLGIVMITFLMVAGTSWYVIMIITQAIDRMEAQNKKR